LQTGEHAALLEDYFGPQEYAELRQLSREAAARSVRGGPKVLILPGMMGSKLGKRRRIGIFDDTYWFDPIDIAAGRLTQLALPGPRFEVLGVMLTAYLKLKLRLQVGGYDAQFYPYDWRQSIADLGQDLAQALNVKDGDAVSIVAHSMGGLVSRSALGNGGKCRRLIMLGTPNFGSFAPVQAIRATYPAVRKLGALDLRHTPEELAAEVFTTFPGLAQMLPSPERFHDVDLYDLDNWPEPETGLVPRAPILAGVKAVQRKLAPGDERFFLIAGVDQETVIGLQKDAKGFTYLLSTAGDGTVPLDLARLPDTQTFYASEGHGSLPNNRVVSQAVLDLLDRGDTSVLPRTYAAEPRAGAVRQVAEASLRVDPYPGRRGVLLSQSELRTMLEDVAAPYANDVVAATAPSGTIAPGPADVLDPGYQHPFDRIVVGRRRQHRIDLRFAFGSITEADTRALAVGIFKDVAPSGAARALDQRVDGAITEVSRRRMFSGNVGEIFVLPTGRHAVAADYIAFVGLGAFDRFTDDVLQIAAENLIRTFVSCHVEEFATVLFGGGSGESPASALRNLLVGFIRGLSDADTDHHFRRLVICEWDQERFTDLKGELYRLSSTSLCQDVEFTFDEVALKAPPEMPARAARLRPAKDPMYLIVRQEQSRKGKFDVRTSILTAGQKATVVTGVRTVEERTLDPLIARLVSPAVKDLSSDGLKLAKLLLSDEIVAVLPRHRQHHLIVVHDAPMSRIPWETIALGTGEKAGKPWFPAAEEGLTHRYAAENLSVAKWLEDRLQDDVFTVLLVVNPTEDLDGAEQEGARVRELLANLPGCRMEVLRGGAATRPALLSAFSSGKFDLIHYAGHAFFDQGRPERCGILCHAGSVLSGADLAGLGNLPTLVFFNACESGRIRRTRGSRSVPPTRPAAARVEQVAVGSGFAEAFMRGGVANFLATYWPVGDLAAKVFAAEFYGYLMKGASVREAIQHGRRAVRDKGSKDWADYVFYGDPEFVLKTGAATRNAGAIG
jgi:CHAT domain-containing protein/pimeloyl-ACP methyl ester carboxylesterase